MCRRYCLFVFFSVFVVFNLWATTREGGKGLMYVHSARVINKGYLEFYGGTRFFGKVASFGTANRAYTLWNVQGFSSFNYGVSHHLEFAVSPIFYQDTNRGSGFSKEAVDSPDDLFLSIKLGSFGALESPFLFGGMLYTRIPTARQHNIIYEPYSAGSVEVGITGLASYFHNPIFPDAGWSIHANLGYLNHNDVGKDLTGDSLNLAPTPTSMSSEFLFGLGLRYPAETFDFSVEINGRYFLTQPPVSAYSREYVSYLTTGVYYKPYPWVTFEMGIDLRLISQEDLTDYTVTPRPKPQENFPNYPSWRGILGVKLAIFPTSLYASPEEKLLKKKATDRKTILERMMKEQTTTKNAESELSRIKAERKKAEEELQRLRKLLEAEKKKKKEKKK